MMRNWIAVALLSVSWMWGLEYYTAANGWLWSIGVLAAVLLLAELPRRSPCRTDTMIAIVLILPTLWMLPWPYLAIPVGFALGLMPLAVGNAPQWSVAIGWAAVRSAAIMTGQAIVLRGYSLLTARCHDLPGPASSLVAMMARLLGAEASADGTEVVIFSASKPQTLAATWELVFDPVTVGLLAGAIVMVALWTWEDRLSKTQDFRSTLRRWLRMVGYVVLAIGLWIPVRLGLLLGLFLQREMRAPDELKLTVMNQFFTPWVLAVVSLGAVASLAYWVRRTPADSLPNELKQPSWTSNLPKRAAAAASAVVLIGMATTLLTIDPIGQPQEGRVAFVERHSDWEPTDRAYDTVSFGHDPSYSYTAIYNYCQQYFHVSRLEDHERIDAARLNDCDVLVIKTPTEPYSPDEIREVLRFVARGGGLLLIGEHTDYSHIGTQLNQIAEPLGFKFRPDILFGVEEPYVQHVTPRRFPHPAVRNVPFMRYAGSCSIDPGWSWGRSAVWNTGLWSLEADYNMGNYFPDANYLSEMRYGAFLQLWETRHGKGRVLAFTDSTIFSNFSTFEPGKAEMMRDMVAWLNCRSAFDSTGLRILVRLSGLLTLAVLAWLGATRFPRTEGAWLVWLGCALLGYLAATAAIAAWQRGGLPTCKRPLVRVVLDRTSSRVPLSEGGFTHEPNGYGLLEQWIPRLGHYTVRAGGPEAFSGDVLLVVSPTESVSEDYRSQLVQWVSEGGKLVVLDSPDSYGTTANSLLWPFGIAVYHATAAQGTLRIENADWPGISVPSTCQVEGGEPFVWIGNTPVAATTRHGKGTVTAIGFGSLMNNANMGGNWVPEPGPAELLIYDVLFELMNSVVEDRPVEPPHPAETPQNNSPDSDSEAIRMIQNEPRLP